MFQLSNVRSDHMEKLKVENYDAHGRFIPDMSKVKLYEVAPETHEFVINVLRQERSGA